MSYGLIAGLWIHITHGAPFPAVSGIQLDPAAMLQDKGSLFFVACSSWLLYLLIVRSVVSVHRSEEAVRLRDRAVASSTNAVVIIESSKPGAPIVYVNAAFERITGYAAAEVIGKNCRFLLRDDHDQPELEAIRAAFRDQRECHVTLRNYRKDGSLFWNDVYLAPVRNESGQVTNFIGVETDVTDVKRRQDELEHLASHDALTGLPNRSLLHDRLQQAIAYAQRQRSVVAVASINLDRFKVINDSLGHVAGDCVLRTTAERIKSCLRQSDTVARSGDDEFVLVVYDQASEEGISSLLNRILDATSKPFSLDKHELFVTCSIGVSFYPRDGRDATALLRNADAAMYQAKARGRNNFRFYAAEMNAKVAGRLSLASGLRRALDRNEFLLHYQPQIDLYSGRITGAEALIRWQHPTRGMVAPGMFIPVAEETGLILPIGEWVVHTACTQARERLKAGFPPLNVSVNVSVRQFMRKDLVESLLKTVKHSQLDTQDLELEVTESLIMNNAEEFIAILKKLKETGIKLAIDDFGTGYSSLNYLKRMPIDRLKVDQSFVRDINKDTPSTTIVEAIISLGHSLRLKVIAEGVETGEQLEFLRHRGCDEFQGFYFSRPIPADRFESLLKQEQQRVSPLGAAFEQHGLRQQPKGLVSELKAG